MAGVFELAFIFGALQGKLVQLNEREPAKVLTE